MKRFKGLLAAIFTVMGTILCPEHAQAGVEFQQLSDMQVSPNYDGGTASGLVVGRNFVALSTWSSIDYSVDQETGVVRIYTSFNVSGNCMEPTENPDYLDFMEETGFTTYNRLEITRITVNGEWYEYDTEVSMILNGNANISRDAEHTEMFGLGLARATGLGAIPVRSWCTVEVFDEGHPDWVNDAEFSIYSEWRVQASLHLVPAPGSAALLCFAGLAATRRRRR